MIFVLYIFCSFGKAQNFWTTKISQFIVVKFYLTEFRTFLNCVGQKFTHFLHFLLIFAVLNLGFGTLRECGEGTCSLMYMRRPD